MSQTIQRTAVVAACIALFSTSASAHGVAADGTGVAFPFVVAGVVVVSLLGGGVVLWTYGQFSWSPGRAVLPALVFALGAAALLVAVSQAVTVSLVGLAAGVGVVYLARDAALTDCGTCADAALGAVTLHRGLEGMVLATVYAADAALGLAGAVIVAGHAAAETAAVGSLYATAGRWYAIGAVLVVQLGFVAGVATGWAFAVGIPPTAEAGVLALVGGVLLAVGAREARQRQVAGVTAA